jgi:phenylacetic acid degradation operon negative regulatory protein
LLESDLIFGIIASFNRTEYSVQELKYLSAPFNISESNLRAALSRMVKRGFLAKRRTGKQAFYYRSNKGQNLSSNVALRFENTDWSEWNRQWWGVCFSISETDKQDRYKIRKKLINYHFKPLYSGIWIRPYNIKQNIPEVLNSDYITKSARIIQFKPEVEFTKEFISSLWNIRNINTGFITGLQLINKKSKFNSMKPEQAFFNMMIIGGQIVKILFSDPVLPDCYLPDSWKANELRDKFNGFITTSREVSRSFWEKIF